MERKGGGRCSATRWEHQACIGNTIAEERRSSRSHAHAAGGTHKKDTSETTKSTARARSSSNSEARSSGACMHKGEAKASKAARALCVCDATATAAGERLR